MTVKKTHSTGETTCGDYFTVVAWFYLMILKQKSKHSCCTTTKVRTRYNKIYFIANLMLLKTYLKNLVLSETALSSKKKNELGLSSIQVC